jgi:transposase
MAQKGTSSKIYDMLVTLGDKHPSYSAVKIWVTRFRTGHLSSEDEERSGRPTQVTSPNNAVAYMGLDDRRISANKMTENPDDIPRKRF